MVVDLPNRLIGEGSNHSTLLYPKGNGSERLEKRHTEVCQMSIRKVNASEPLMRYRKS